MSLTALLQCVVRLFFSFIITTLMYAADPAKRTYMWVQLATVAFSVTTGAAVVTLFFRRLSAAYPRNSDEYR